MTIEEKEVLPGKLMGGKFGGKARYTVEIDAPQASVEANYFGILNLLEGKIPFGTSYAEDEGEIKKIKDIYTAGETSAYFGMVEQRKGAQQDKFQQIMANIGQMVKTLFQMLRELRIIDERLDYYEKSMAGDKAAEIALKSIWVDMVEGGAKNAASVLGLATQVGFVTLPDLFFTVHPKNEDTVEKEVEKLKKGGINRKVREVLMRKLKQYMTWKKRTHKELVTGKDFKLKYMRQHYHVIKVYLNWLRPYLRNIRRLQMKETADDKDIMAAFDTTKIELEILAIKKKYELEINPTTKEERQFQFYFPIVRVQLRFVAMPQLAYQQEGFQRGAIHVGKTKIVIEGFVATKKELEEYERSIEAEDLELLEVVDASIGALKEELEYYLEKAGEIKKPEEQPKTREGILSPFKAIIDGFRELFGLPAAVRRATGEGPKVSAKQKLAEKGAAGGIAKFDSYITYKIFKKQNGMMTE